MPSSFTTVLSSALGYSPHPPVSVYGTGTISARRTRLFLAAWRLQNQRNNSSSWLTLGYGTTGFAWPVPPMISQRTMSIRHAPHSLPRPPTAQTLSIVVRNMNLLPIDYAFRPRLRSRLTLGGLTFPRNPWVCGEQVSHLFFRYLCHHSHFRFVHRSSRSDFSLPRNAPLPLIVYRYTISPKLRWCALAPLHFRRKIARPVSYYALF